MSREMIEKALARATDTKACVIGDGALEGLAGMFREQFPGADRAIVICDPRTRAAAGTRTVSREIRRNLSVAESAPSLSRRPHSLYFQPGSQSTKRETGVSPARYSSKPTTFISGASPPMASSSGEAERSQAKQ